MAIIVNRNEQKIEKIIVQLLSYIIQFTTTCNNKLVYLFEIINDNLPNCPAHIKTLDPEEMLAIYEYMKKVVGEA